MKLRCIANVRRCIQCVVGCRLGQFPLVDHQKTQNAAFIFIIIALFSILISTFILVFCVRYQLLPSLSVIALIVLIHHHELATSMLNLNNHVALNKRKRNQ